MREEIRQSADAAPTPPKLRHAKRHDPGRLLRFSTCGRLYKGLGDASKRAGVELLAASPSMSWLTFGARGCADMVVSPRRAWSRRVLGALDGRRQSMNPRCNAKRRARLTACPFWRKVRASGIGQDLSD